MIGIKSSKDPRAKVQNGLWGFKLIVLAGFVVAGFFIPNKGFTEAFMIIGLIGGFMVRVNRRFIRSIDFFVCSSFWFNYFYRLISFIRKFDRPKRFLFIRWNLDGMNHGLTTSNLVRKNMDMVYYFSPYSSMLYPSRVLSSSTYTMLQIVQPVVYIHSSSPLIYVFALFYQSFQFYHKYENTIIHVVYFNHHLLLSMLCIILGK